MSDPLLTASVIEGALLLCGVFFLWRCALRPSARAAASGPQPLPFWDVPGYVFGFTVLRVVCIALGVQILSTSLIKHLHPEFSLREGFGLFISGMIFQGSVLIGVAAAAYFLKPSRFVAELNAFSSETTPPPPRLPQAKIPLTAFATFTIILVVLTPLSLLWPWLLERMGQTLTTQDAATFFTQADSPLHIALLLLFATLIAPVTEELVFRAGLFRYLRGRLPRAVVLLLPAILFAALHNNLTVGLPLLVFGLIQSLAYERTGRIVVPIIAHGLFNLHTAVLILADLDPYAFLQSSPGP